MNSYFAVPSGKQHAAVTVARCIETATTATDAATLDESADILTDALLARRHCW